MFPFLNLHELYFSRPNHVHALGAMTSGAQAFSVTARKEVSPLEVG